MIILKNAEVFPLRFFDLSFFLHYRTVSRVLSWTVIYLGFTLPQSSLPPWGQNAEQAWLWVINPRCLPQGVAPDRVYTAHGVSIMSLSSYLAFSSLPLRAVIFCCTFPKVALGGRYPLSCSVKPGLSLRCCFRLQSHNRLVR